MSHCPEVLPPSIIAPLLTPQCIRLMSEEASTEEDELWQSLGDAWNIPRCNKTSLILWLLFVYSWESVLLNVSRAIKHVLLLLSVPSGQKMMRTSQPTPRSSSMAGSPLKSLQNLPPLHLWPDRGVHPNLWPDQRAHNLHPVNQWPGRRIDNLRPVR